MKKVNFILFARSYSSKEKAFLCLVGVRISRLSYNFVPENFLWDIKVQKQQEDNSMEEAERNSRKDLKTEHYGRSKA